MSRAKTVSELTKGKFPEYKSRRELEKMTVPNLRHYAAQLNKAVRINYSKMRKTELIKQIKRIRKLRNEKYAEGGKGKGRSKRKIAPYRGYVRSSSPPI